jgi:hypothetical protein
VTRLPTATWLAIAALSAGCGRSSYDVGGESRASGGAAGESAGGVGASQAGTSGSGASGSSGSMGCVSVERCNGVDDDCDDAVDEDATCPDDCHPLVAPAGRFTYCNRRQDFAAAEASCQALGLKLPRLDSAAKNAAALAATVDQTSDEVGFFLDAELTGSGAWQWRGGAVFWQGDHQGTPTLGAYSNWLPFNPNTDPAQTCAQSFVAASFRAGQWDDLPCSKARAVLCEDR